MDLFKEELTKAALLKHQLWDHKIKLKLGLELILSPIYQLLEKDLGTLKETIDKDLKRGFIRESKSPA